MGYKVEGFKEAKLRISPNRDSVIIKNGPLDRRMMNQFTKAVIIYDIMSKCKVRMTGKPIAGKLTEPYACASRYSFVDDLFTHGRVVEKCLREHFNDKSFDNEKDHVNYLIEVTLNEIFTTLISVVEEYYRHLNIEGEYLIQLAKRCVQWRTTQTIENDIPYDISERRGISLEGAYHSIIKSIDIELQIVRLIKPPVNEVIDNILYKLIVPIGEHVNNAIFDGRTSIDFHIVSTDNLHCKEEESASGDVTDAIAYLERMVRATTPDNSLRPVDGPLEDAMDVLYLDRLK